jgi:transketolase N-terminal domain/subunit
LQQQHFAPAAALASATTQQYRRTAAGAVHQKKAAVPLQAVALLGLFCFHQPYRQWHAAPLLCAVLGHALPAYYCNVADNGMLHHRYYSDVRSALEIAKRLEADSSRVRTADSIAAHLQVLVLLRLPDSFEPC